MRSLSDECVSMLNSFIDIYKAEHNMSWSSRVDKNGSLYLHVNVDFKQYVLNGVSNSITISVLEKFLMGIVTRSSLHPRVNADESSGCVVNVQRYSRGGVTSSTNNQTKGRVINRLRTVEDRRYNGVSFKRIIEDIPNTSLQKIVDWCIVFEGEVIYKLSESKSNSGDTFLDRLKWAIEHKYPFILVDVSYPDIGGYLKISTIPNVTRPMTVDDGMFIIPPFNVAEKFGANLDFDYSTECERINIAIGKILDHCGYKE